MIPNVIAMIKVRMRLLVLKNGLLEIDIWVGIIRFVIILSWIWSVLI